MSTLWIFLSSQFSFLVTLWYQRLNKKLREWTKKKSVSETEQIYFYMDAPIIMCRNYSIISVYFQFLNLEMVVLTVLREFAGGTSLHGFGFLVSPKSSPRTKIIWALSIIVAIMYASSEMRNSVISKYHHIFRIMK